VVVRVVGRGLVHRVYTCVLVVAGCSLGMMIPREYYMVATVCALWILLAYVVMRPYGSTLVPR
jgi:hypothetical protein